MNKVLSAILILFSIIIIFYLAFDAVFNSMLSSEHKTLEVTNTAIQFILLITGVITIVMLFVNYNQQKKQIEENNQDIEFNRVLDIIYKHIDTTNKEFNELSKRRVLSNTPNTAYWNLVDYKRHFSHLIDGTVDAKKLGDLLQKEKKLAEYYRNIKGRLGVYTNDFIRIITIYKTLITNNGKLTTEQKNVLGLIVRDLFYEKEVYHLVRYRDFLNVHLNEIEPYLKHIYANNEDAIKFLKSITELSETIESLNNNFKQ